MNFWKIKHWWTYHVDSLRMFMKRPRKKSLRLRRSKGIGWRGLATGEGQGPLPNVVMTPYGPCLAPRDVPPIRDPERTVDVRPDFVSREAPEQWQTHVDGAVFRCENALRRAADQPAEIPLPVLLGGPGRLHLDPERRELWAVIEGRWSHLPKEGLPGAFLQLGVGKSELHDAIRHAALWAQGLRALCKLREQVAVECRKRRLDPEVFVRKARELGAPEYLEDMTPLACTRLLEWLREQPRKTQPRKSQARAA